MYLTYIDDLKIQFIQYLQCVGAIFIDPIWILTNYHNLIHKLHDKKKKDRRRMNEADYVINGVYEKRR